MTRRHTRRWGLYQIGHTTPPPISTGPHITSVSQSQGTIDGGKTITVNGSGFVNAPAMTSALGTVAYVSSTQCTITTAAHAAGTLSWTITAAGIPAPESQTFTYLAHPSFQSISPTHGPQTLTTPNVTVNCTGLPTTSGTGCPVTVTVDGNAATSIALVNSSSLTCTFPAVSSSGTKNVVVTVDGVTTTGSGAWTADPPPIDLTSTGVGTGGGTGTITGQNFVNGCTASVNINGTPTTLTITFVSATNLSFQLASGSYTASSPPGWPLTITNPDGQSDTESIFTISAFTTPDVIFGANLRAWYRSTEGITTSGGVVSQWAEKTGNGPNVTAAGTAQPAYNSTSPSGFFNMLPTVTWDGVNDVLSGSFAPGSTTKIGFYTVYRETAHVDNQPYVDYTDVGARTFHLQADNSNPTKPCFVTTGGSVIQPTALTVGNVAQLYAFVNGTDHECALNNATASVGTFADSIGGSGTLRLGANGGGAFGKIESPEFVVINTNPSSQNNLDVAKYFNLRYQINSVSVSTISSIGIDGSSGFRITGTGFISGITVTATSATLGTIVSNVTATFISSTVIDVPVPGGSYAAGSYTVSVTNQDGSEQTVSNGLTVTTADDPMTIAGIKCIGWYRGDLGLSLDGSNNVITWADQSGLSQTMAGGSHRPAYSSSLANFNNQPGLSFDGTTQYLVCSSFSLNSGTFLEAHAVCRVTTNSNTGAIFGNASTNTPELRCDTNGTSKPYTAWGQNPPSAAQGGSSILNAAVALYGNWTGGASTYVEALNVGNVSEVVFSGGAARTLSTNVAQGIGARPTGTIFVAMTAPEFAFFNAALTSGQHTRLQAYFHSRYGV